MFKAAELWMKKKKNFVNKENLAIRRYSSLRYIFVNAKISDVYLFGGYYSYSHL